MAAAGVDLRKQESCLKTIHTQLDELEKIMSKIPITPGSGRLKKFLKEILNLEEHVQHIATNVLQKAKRSRIATSKQDIATLKEVIHPPFVNNCVNKEHSSLLSERTNQTSKDALDKTQEGHKAKDHAKAQTKKDTHVEQQSNKSLRCKDNMETESIKGTPNKGEENTVTMKPKTQKKKNRIENVTECTQCNARFMGNKAKYNYQRHKAKCKWIPCDCPQIGKHIPPCRNRNTRGYGGYQCNSCTKRFHNKAHLNKHIEDKH